MRYYVYVIELNKKVFSESKKFRDANPQFNGVLECLYVGMTSKNPFERFLQHRTGAKSKRGFKLASSLVLKYGAYLRPGLYQSYNLIPMNQKEALQTEKELAILLRRKGYAVWFN